MVNDKVLKEVNKIVYQVVCLFSRDERYTTDIERRVSAGSSEWTIGKLLGIANCHFTDSLLIV